MEPFLGVTEKITNDVFSAPNMQQDEVVLAVQDIVCLVDRTLVAIVFGCRWFTNSIMPFCSSILNGNVRKKRILKNSEGKDKNLSESGLVDLNEEESKFLSSCLMLFYDIGTRQDPEYVVNAFKSSQLARSIKENIILAFKRVTDEYMLLSNNYNTEVRRWLNGDDVDVETLNELSTNMRVFEDLVGARTDLRGVILHVRHLIKLADIQRSKIVSAYRRIAFRLAKRHSPSDGSHLIDNFQNGCLGLVKAVSYYDPDKKTRFSKYAETWIRQSMLLHLKETSNFVRIAPQSWSLFRQFEKVSERLEMRSGSSDVTSEQIAVQYLLDNKEEVNEESIKKTVVRYNSLREQTKLAYVKSLDYSYDEDGTPIIDKVSSPTKTAEVSVSFGGLSDQERRWICMLFGDLSRLKMSVNSKDVLEEQTRQEKHAL